MAPRLIGLFTQCVVGCGSCDALPLKVQADALASQHDARSVRNPFLLLLLPAPIKVFYLLPVYPKACLVFNVELTTMLGILSIQKKKKKPVTVLPLKVYPEARPPDSSSKFSFLTTYAAHQPCDAC